MVKAYCTSERKSVEVKDPKYVLNKRGSPMVRGKCPSCGNTVVSIISADKAPPEIRAKMKKKGGHSRRSKRSRRSNRSRK